MIHTLQAVWGARTAAVLKCSNAAIMYDGHKPVQTQSGDVLKLVDIAH